MEVSAFELTDEFFLDFYWEAASFGYMFGFDKNEYGAAFPDRLSAAFPNHLLVPLSPCLVVNQAGRGLVAHLLAASMKNPKDTKATFVFGWGEPFNAVFECDASNYQAVHNVLLPDGEHGIERTTFRAFEDEGLTNTIGAFSVNQTWRPWQTKAH